MRRSVYTRSELPSAWFCPFVPSSQKRIDRLIATVGKHLGPADVVYDLGCGDGRVLLALAKHTPCRCVGVDIDPLLIASAESKTACAAAAGLARAQERLIWRCGDMLTTDLSTPRATLVLLYLIPSAHRLLEVRHCPLHFVLRTDRPSKLCSS